MIPALRIFNITFNVLEKIRRGQADIRDGKHFSREETRERLSKWLNP